MIKLTLENIIDLGDEISEKLGASRSAIATWINDLKDAGIIKTKKIGYNRYIEILDE